jgi:hypothetical protein
MMETNNVKRKEELQNELEKLKELKNEAIKSQQYDVAVNLREKQREVEEELKKLNQQN